MFQFIRIIKKKKKTKMDKNNGEERLLNNCENQFSKFSPICRKKRCLAKAKNLSYYNFFKL